MKRYRGTDNKDASKFCTKGSLYVKVRNMAKVRYLEAISDKYFAVRTSPSVEIITRSSRKN
jgi:hypothetical protein